MSQDSILEFLLQNLPQFVQLIVVVVLITYVKKVTKIFMNSGYAQSLKKIADNPLFRTQQSLLAQKREEILRFKNEGKEIPDELQDEVENIGAKMNSVMNKYNPEELENEKFR